MGGRWRWCGALLIGGALTMVAACGATAVSTPPTSPGSAPPVGSVVSPPPSGSGSTPPAGFSAELKVGRMDKAARIVTVRVQNDSATDVRIAGAWFEAAWYPDEVPVRRAGLLRSGAALALAFAMPDPGVCGTDAPADTRVRLTLDDGTDLVLTPVDTYRALADLHAEDCARAQLAAAGTLTFGDTLTVLERDGNPVGSLDLTFTPTPDAVGLPAVRVTEIGRTTLIVPADGANWQPTGLDSTSGAPVTATIELVPARCDPHAVAEDKRGTYLPTSITVDGVAAPVIYTAMDLPLRGQIYDYVAQYCGWQ